MLLFFASVCLAKALPVLERLARLLREPQVFSPDPLLLPALASLVAGGLLAWGLLDAVFDRRLPLVGVAALVALAVLPWGVRKTGPEDESRYLHHLAARLAEEIGRRIGRGEAPEAIVAALESIPSRGPYRSRWLRAEPHRVRLLPPGVALPEEEDAGPPGTFHVSIFDEGGWVSVSRSTPRGPRLSRMGGGVAVFRIFTPPREVEAREL
jgi:hypothetical protein